MVAESPVANITYCRHSRLDPLHLYCPWTVFRKNWVSPEIVHVIHSSVLRSDFNWLIVVQCNMIRLSLEIQIWSKLTMAEKSVNEKKLLCWCFFKFNKMRVLSFRGQRCLPYFKEHWCFFVRRPILVRDIKDLFYLNRLTLGDVCILVTTTRTIFFSSCQVIPLLKFCWKIMYAFLKYKYS